MTRDITPRCLETDVQDVLNQNTVSPTVSRFSPSGFVSLRQPTVGSMARSSSYPDDALRHAVAVSRSWRGVLRELGLLATSASAMRTARRRADTLDLDYSHFTPKMNAKYGPLYAEAKIPKSTYAGMEQDANNITMWNILAVNEKMGEDEAYRVTKILFESLDDLAKVHKEALNIKIESQSVKRSGVPFHPGALRYFKEKKINVE